jgi:hypothetical protein
MNGAAESRLRAAALGLVAVGVVNLGVSALFALTKVFADTGQAPADSAERAGYLTAQYGPFATGPVAVITTFAGALLLARRSRRLGQVAAALNVVPCLGCCFLAGIPVGIWVLIVLARPDVQALFEPAQPGGYPPYGGYGPTGYGQPPQRY